MQTQIPVRKGNWFGRSRISFVDSFWFIYFWSKEELTSIKICYEELDMCNKIVIDWNNYLYEICIKDLSARKNKKIGRLYRIVEDG